jgi:hypothetical protein
MAKNISKLHKRVIRRVYYAYALRVMTLPGVPQGFLTLFALIGLTYFVSIGNVIQNMMTVASVKGFEQFAYNAITNTEAWTLLIIGFMIFSLFSFRFTFKTPRFEAYVANRGS